MVDIIWRDRKRNRKISGGKSQVNKDMILKIGVLWDTSKKGDT